MKRLILLFFCISLFFAGCVTLKTNIPFYRTDGVIVTCPVSVGKVVLKKYSRFTEGQEYTVIPGRETRVYADGVFSDQPMTLVGFVYNKKGQVIGRVSREFRFDGNSYEVRIHVWNVTNWESTRSEKDWLW
jgi:hypothetical protein